MYNKKKTSEFNKNKLLYMYRNDGCGDKKYRTIRPNDARAKTIIITI